MHFKLYAHGDDTFLLSILKKTGTDRNDQITPAPVQTIMMIKTPCCYKPSDSIRINSTASITSFDARLRKLFASSVFKSVGILDNK
jgi:hypothetical protein